MSSLGEQGSDLLAGDPIPSSVGLGLSRGFRWIDQSVLSPVSHGDRLVIRPALVSAFLCSFVFGSRFR